MTDTILVWMGFISAVEPNRFAIRPVPWDMTSAADVIFVDGEIHTLTDPDETAEAVAVRDGQVVRVGDTYEIEFLESIDTRVLDLEGRVLLPGFIDAHTHMQQLGQYQVHADLGAADDIDSAVGLLGEAARPDGEWILGFGYDESDWPSGRYPTRSDLDRVSEDRPVAAFRVDMHSASLNSEAIARLGDRLPDEDVKRDDGEPTGVVVERAAEVLWAEIEPGLAETRDLIEAAIEYAHERGVTGVHDMVRKSHAPRVYRDLDVAGDLALRVRLNYWSDHLDAATELGLRPGFGSEFLQIGAIKTYTDGSFGSRTARLSEPFADDPDEQGTWVVEPSELESIVDRATESGFQMAAHAIGDVAIETVIEAYEDVPGDRHRVEHAELAFDEHIEQFAETGAVASVQPNFLRWAGEDGLYERRLGTERRLHADRFARFLEADVPLAFGSDCMPLDPLYGIQQVVNAPTEAQRLSVTDAVRAYTVGSAYAGFDEHRMGTVEAGKVADFVVLDDSPWERPEHIEETDVALTVVDGSIVYDGR